MRLADRNGKDLIGVGKGNEKTLAGGDGVRKPLGKGQGHQAVSKVDDQFGKEDLKIGGLGDHECQPGKLSGAGHIRDGDQRCDPGGKPSLGSHDTEGKADRKISDYDGKGILCTFHKMIFCILILHK